MSAPQPTESSPVNAAPSEMPEPSKASYEANMIVATILGIIAVGMAVVGIAVTW